MDWKEKMEAYKSSVTNSTYKADSLIANRIMKGLGFTGKSLPGVCREMGIDTKDRLEIEMAVDVLDGVSGGMFCPVSPCRRFILDTRGQSDGSKCWKDRMELDELCGIAGGAPDGMVVMCRVDRKASQPTSVSFVFTRTTDTPLPYLLRPVSAMVAESGAMSVWMRKTDELIRDMAECLKWEIPGRS